MSEVIGVKHDGGKPWAGTVLAGFWSQGFDDLFALECARNGMVAEDIAEIGSALSYLFDTDLALSERLVKASEHLIAHANPAAYLPHVIDVGTYGAHKYAADNWLHVDDGVKRYYEAAGRHVRDVVMGDWRDAESGCANLGHICWGILAGSELARRQQAVAVDFETVSIEPCATKPPDVTIRVARVETKPALELPLVIGRRYRLFDRGEDQGVYEAYEAYEAKDFPNDEKKRCVINNWAFYVETGLAPWCESRLRIEGPVES